MKIHVYNRFSVGCGLVAMLLVVSGIHFSWLISYWHPLRLSLFSGAIDSWELQADGGQIGLAKIESNPVDLLPNEVTVEQHSYPVQVVPGVFYFDSESYLPRNPGRSVYRQVGITAEYWILSSISLVAFIFLIWRFWRKGIKLRAKSSFPVGNHIDLSRE